jgi:nucleoside-diphosphate-sugar epimerase
MKIFLTGVTGFVGSHLLDDLIEHGHQVIRHQRPSKKPHNSTGYFSTSQVSFFDIQAIQEELIDIDVVIHCAAYVSTWGYEEDFSNTNILMTKNLLRAAQNAGVKKFIYMSCAFVVMDQLRAMIDLKESSKLTDRRELPYSRSKAMAETVVLEAGCEEFKTIALRPAFLWGRGDIVDRQIGEAAKRGKFGWINQGEYLYSTCYIKNLQFSVRLALQTDLFGQAFFISDGTPMMYRYFMTRRLTIGGFPVPSFSIGVYLAWALARFTENGWKYLPLRGLPPLTREMVRLTGNPFTLSIEKASKLLGYQPTYSVEQALENLSSQYIHH